MSTLIVHHFPTAYFMGPRHLEFGGKLEFRNSYGDNITVPRPVVKAMEKDLQMTTELFPVSIELSGTILYYRLIMPGKHSEAQAAALRFQLNAKIGEILLSHPQIRDIKFKFNRIVFNQESER